MLTSYTNGGLTLQLKSCPIYLLTGQEEPRTRRSEFFTLFQKGLKTQ